MKRRRTLGRVVELVGRGLFSGAEAKVKLLPAAAGFGICFCRTDLPARPQIAATLANVRESPNRTCLGDPTAGGVQTVEHLLSALLAFGITDLMVESFGPEMPIGDGSARLFAKAISEAGVVELEEEIALLKITRPLLWQESGDAYLLALPAGELRVSFYLHYPEEKLLQNQSASFAGEHTKYLEEIASCRTFAFYEHLKPLLARGLLTGGGLDNGLVIKEGRILNPEGVRFANEMARHKLLDLMGDLCLIGSPLQGHFIGVCTGHRANAAFAKKIFEQGKVE